MKFLSAIPIQTYCAYFDLKNANVFIFDGYKGPDVAANTFLVNNVGAVAVQTFTSTVVSGTFTLTFDGQTTTAIPFNATGPIGVQAALVALSTIGPGGVTVAGPASGPWIITFAGALAGKPQPLMLVDNTLAVGGTVAGVTSTPGAYAYPVGATTMLIDSGKGIWNVGDTFKFSQLDVNVGTDDNVYTVTAHTETAGNTTSITFTPALTEGAQDDGQLIIQPHSLNVKLGDGNFTFTEKVPREYKKNRGFLDAVRNGDQDPLEVKLEFAWIFIKSSTGEAIMVEDALKQTGQASNWVTAGHDPCEPYCVTIRLYYVPPCPGVDNEIIDLAEFRYEELQHDAKTGMIACTAKCNLTKPTVTRVHKDTFNQVIVN